jgi:hypothetical protein
MKSILKIVTYTVATMFSSAAFSNTAIQNFHANNCEFLVDGVAQVYQYNQGWFRRTLHAELIVSDESIQKVGMWVKYRNSSTGSIHESISESTEQPLLLSPVSNASKTVEFAFEGSGNSSSENARFYYEVLSFAFFGERDDGAIRTRLWISDNGQNFSLPSTFTEPTYTNSIGRGSVNWANQNVDVFHQKHACASTESLSVSLGAAKQGGATTPSSLKMNLSQNGLGKNFILQHYTFSLGNNFVIPQSAQEAKLLGDFVASRTSEICLARGKPKSLCNTLQSSIRTSHIYIHTGSGASSIFANWLNSVDDNNWFYPNQLQPAIEPYFSVNSRQLFFFSDGNPENSLVEPVTTKGIPVMVDSSDNSITIWTIQLND